MEFTNLSYQSPLPSDNREATERLQYSEQPVKIDLPETFNYPETSDDHVNAPELQYPDLTKNREIPEELQYPGSTKKPNVPAKKGVTFQDENKTEAPVVNSSRSTPPPPYSEKLRSFGSSIPVEFSYMSQQKKPVRLSARQLAYYHRESDEVCMNPAQPRHQMKDLDEKKRKGVIAVLVFIFLFVLVFNIWYFASRVKIV